MDASLAAAAASSERLARARTVCELFQASARERPEERALRDFDGTLELSWREYGEQVRRIAGGLAALGVGRGDAVAMMMSNRVEFALLDCAAMHLGATPFSIYNTFPPDTISHLLANAGARVCVCEQQFSERLLAALAGSAVEHVLCVESGVPGTTALEEIPGSPPGFEFEQCWQAVQGDDVLTLIYTSGTTGPPKGVELTHANMLAQLRATAAVLPIAAGGRTVSYLPSAHIADRWLSLYAAHAHRIAITYVADQAQLGAAVAQTRPTIWGGVPRVWEKIRAALEAAIAADPDAARRDAVRAAIAAGTEVVRRQQAGEPIDSALARAHRLADEQVLRRLRERLGLDEVEWLVVGAAPAPPELLEFFAGIGLELLELWGMSELSCVCTTNLPGANRIGTVGPPIPGLELELAEDGELLVRGATVMAGYRGEPRKTAETIDPEGWLHTGDIGRIDPDGYVSIIDRKKELIINAAGKNMSPANIESQLKECHPLVGQAMCVGDRRPYNVALLVLDPDAAATWAREHGRAEASVAELAACVELRAELQEAVERANAKLARVEQIKRFHLLDAEWLPGGDELTPTMKLRRKPIAEKYAVQIDALYAG
jgi:long-subunit acyl-CoA synthetase (AMP-forming)